MLFANDIGRVRLAALRKATDLLLIPAEFRAAIS